MSEYLRARSQFGLETYRRIEATSIMSGISNENPALDFVRWIA
jgi:hypothetical protein